MYPEHCDIPKEIVMDETLRVTKDLLNAFKKLKGQKAMQPGRHISALKTLLEIFHDKTISLETTVKRVHQASSS